MTSVLGVIPARRGSRRLPNKPLLDLVGIPMVVRVARKAKQAACFSELKIATDDEEIAAVVRAWGFDAELTSENHPSGTTRVGEVAARSQPSELVVNIQGDEPLIDPADLQKLVESALRGASPMASLMRPEVAPTPLPPDPSQVWVAVDGEHFAVDFWRGRSDVWGQGSSQVRAHVGVYAYQPHVLTRLIALPASTLETARKLEQLRALENEVPIRMTMCQSEHPSRGVDTSDDVEWVRLRLSQQD